MSKGGATHTERGSNFLAGRALPQFQPATGNILLTTRTAAAENASTESEWADRVCIHVISMKKEENYLVNVL